MNIAPTVERLAICAKIKILELLILCAGSSTGNSHCHRYNKFSSGNPSACRQLCSYWRIYFWVLSWVCVFDPTPV